MIKFNLESALNGHDLITRSCRRVVGFYKHDDNLFKYSALIDNRLWFKSTCDAHGKAYHGDSSQDLFLSTSEHEYK